MWLTCSVQTIPLLTTCGLTRLSEQQQLTRNNVVTIDNAKCVNAAAGKCESDPIRHHNRRRFQPDLCRVRVTVCSHVRLWELPSQFLAGSLLCSRHYLLTCQAVRVTVADSSRLFVVFASLSARMSGCESYRRWFQPDLCRIRVTICSHVRLWELPSLILAGSLLCSSHYLFAYVIYESYCKRFQPDLSCVRGVGCFQRLLTPFVILILQTVDEFCFRMQAVQLSLKPRRSFRSAFNSHSVAPSLATAVMLVFWLASCVTSTSCRPFSFNLPLSLFCASSNDAKYSFFFFFFFSVCVCVCVCVCARARARGCEFCCCFVVLFCWWAFICFVCF